MAQIFQLGRCGLAAASGGDGLTVRVDSWAQDGDEVRVSGHLRGSDFTSLADLKHAVAQLNGYGVQNTDEPVVPVTWSENSSVDGFYRVLSVKVDPEVTGRLRASASVGALDIPWSADLIRVPGYQAPMVEVISSGALRTNSYSYTNGGVQSWAGWSGDSHQGGLAWNVTVTNETGRAGVEANTYFYNDPGDDLYDAYGTASMDPEYWFEGACRIEASYDSGTTWRTVTGRQIENLPLYWRLRNNLVRVTPTSGQTSSQARIDVEHFNGSTSAYGASKTYALYYSSNLTEFAGLKSVTVLRNSPEACAVRVWMGGSGEAYVDFTVRHTSWIVEANIVAAGNDTGNYGVARATNEAATVIGGGGGIEASGDDAASNRFQIMSPVTHTTRNLTTTSGIYSTSLVESFPFGLANDYAWVGTSSSTQTYFAAMNHRWVVSAR